MDILSNLGRSEGALLRQEVEPAGNVIVADELGVFAVGVVVESRCAQRGVRPCRHHAPPCFRAALSGACARTVLESGQTELWDARRQQRFTKSVSHGEERTSRIAVGPDARQYRAHLVRIYLADEVGAVAHNGARAGLNAACSALGVD